MMHRIAVLPQQQNIMAADGANLLQVLHQAGHSPDAPCGGNGSCGKCKVLADGKEVLACQTVVDRDMTVVLRPAQPLHTIFEHTQAAGSSKQDGYLLALDIGTTTVVGYLLDADGQTLGCESLQNPQATSGADVISRIRHALNGQMEVLTALIRKCVTQITHTLCRQAGIVPTQIYRVSLVGNPAMQQLFLGICPENLVQIPFAPALTKAQSVTAREYVNDWENAALTIVPDISGYVGADTVGALLATKLAEEETLTLLVDIGTNGEMVLGNRHRMVSCATAAGPALEGASIQFGMRGQTGAIDRVWLEDGQLKYHVLGDGEAAGICGSGLVDAVAAALDAGWLNERGKILREDGLIPLTHKIYLTQEDIRQVQMAKGAIAAGIRLMADHLGVEIRQIRKVHLAGAFGTCLRVDAACRIGLLPEELEECICTAGNAAGNGAKLLACDPALLEKAQQLAEEIECLELASVPGFQRCFAEQMRFEATADYWVKKALAYGFSCAAPLDISTLLPRQDVRDMCAADKCRAYGKNWTCPPYCGTLNACAEKMQGYSHGILLQTVGQTEKAIDTRAYRRTEQQHLTLFYGFADLLRARYPQALCLGTGGCRICATCAWPEPCRFPEKACASMEAYGLFVTQVCRDNNCAYSHGEKTVTYTACMLF